MDKLKEDIFKILFPSADTARAADCEMIEKIIALVRTDTLGQPYQHISVLGDGWGSHTA